MNAHHIMQYPPGGWRLHPWPWVIGKRRVMPLQRLTTAGLQGRRHQHTPGHDQQEGHAPLGCFEGARGGQQRGLCHEAHPALRMRLACGACHQCLRWPWGGGACVGGQDDTPVRGEAGWSGRTRGGQGPLAVVDQRLGLHALSGASPCAIAGRRAHGAGPQNRGRHVRRAGRTRLTRLGFARPGDAASCLPGVDVLGTRLAPWLVNGALGWSLAGLGVDEDPAWRHAAVRRGQLMRARARLQRSQGRRLGVGHGRLGCAPGCRNTGAPLPLRPGQVRTVGLAIEGPSGDPRGQAVGGVPRLHMEPNRLATAVGSTAVATAWCQPEGDTRVGLPHPLPHDRMAVRPLIPALPSGAGHALFRGCLVAVGAPIDMNARRVELAHAGCQTQALGRGCRKEAVAFGHPIGIEGIHGPASGISMALLRGHAGRHAWGGGRRVEASGDPVEGLLETPQAMAHHGVDGFTPGEVAHVRVWWGRLLEDLAPTECVEPASAKAEVGDDLATGRGWIGPHPLLCWGGDGQRTPERHTHDSNFRQRCGKSDISRGSARNTRSPRARSWSMKC